MVAQMTNSRMRKIALVSLAASLPSAVAPAASIIDGKEVFSLQCKITVDLFSLDMAIAGRELTHTYTIDLRSLRYMTVWQDGRS